MRIMSFDPGGTTGVAVWGDEYCGTWETRGLRPIYADLSGYKPDQVVIESFTYQRRDKVDLTPVEVIGVIKLWCEIHEIPYKVQSPATGKSFWTDKKLKQIGMYEASKGHAMDALRHLLYYFSFTMNNDFYVRMLKPSD